MAFAGTTVVFVATFIAMELVAAASHRFIMHGLLWKWHEDHHVPANRVFQKNDRFALIFAIPSWLLIMFGMRAGQGDVRTAIGVGILVYGLAYTLVHETIIHRRFRWRLRMDHWYFVALREAHAEHHQRRTKNGCTNFGMLLVPLRFYQKQRRRHRYMRRID